MPAVSKAKAVEADGVFCSSAVKLEEQRRSNGSARLAVHPS